MQDVVLSSPNEVTGERKAKVETETETEQNRGCQDPANEVASIGDALDELDKYLGENVKGYKAAKDNKVLRVEVERAERYYSPNKHSSPPAESRLGGEDLQVSDLGARTTVPVLRPNIKQLPGSRRGEEESLQQRGKVWSEDGRLEKAATEDPRHWEASGKPYSRPAGISTRAMAEEVPSAFVPYTYHAMRSKDFQHDSPPAQLMGRYTKPSAGKYTALLGKDKDSGDNKYKYQS